MLSSFVIQSNLAVIEDTTYSTKSEIREILSTVNKPLMKNSTRFPITLPPHPSPHKKVQTNLNKTNMCAKLSNCLLCTHNYLAQFSRTEMFHELTFGEDLIYMNIKLNYTMCLKWFIMIKISTHCKNISAKHNTNYYTINCINLTTCFG